MRVVLLYPEVYDMARFKERRKEFPPFGVLYLAGVIERAGHLVWIKKVTPYETELELSDYDAIGFSLASSATYGFMCEARDKSSIRDDALIMVGGVHCNFYPHTSVADFRAHVAADGESEETILEILDRADTKRFDGLAGVLWRDGKELRRERPRPLLRNIDQLPLPARHLLPLEDFVISDRLAGRDLRMAHVMFSRGCPFPCGFCAAGQTQIQYRSGVSARQELTHLIDKYGIDGFAIVDDNFIVNKNKVGDICDHIDDLNLRWSGLSRAAIITAMRESTLEFVAVRAPWCAEPMYMYRDRFEEFQRTATVQRYSGLNFLAHEDVALKAYFETRRRYLVVLCY